MSLVRRPGWILMFLVAAVSLVVLTSSVVPFAEIREQRIELENARARFASLQSQGDELAARIDALDDPVEIERIARERLGYVRPGETAYVVMDPEPLAGTGQTVVAEQTAVAPWYLRIWAFLTGADL
jgi:cell division protein FtsB